MYEIEISHPGLNKFRIIRNSNYYAAQRMAATQAAAWQELWERKESRLLKEQQKTQKAIDKQAKLTFAINQTNEAKEAIARLDGILEHTLHINDAVDWEALKDHSIFAKPQPKAPEYSSYAQQPERNDIKYKPKIGIVEKIISSKRKRALEASDNAFLNDHNNWLLNSKEIEKNNNILHGVYLQALSRWEEERKHFENEKEAKNAAVDEMKNRYLSAENDAITEYCEIVLSNSSYPDYFPQEFDIDYTASTKSLVVNYSLPALDAIPRIKEVKYIQSRDEFTQSTLKDSEVNRIYDSLIYQITLRTIHELFEADVVNAIDSIIFNGWVRSIDKAVGMETNACILTIQTSRNEFLGINLSNIDPKTCFKSLKGIGSSQLHSLTPVAPILNICRDDKRFVASYGVADEIYEETNIAAMDWEDFEHLIRELFEKEFSQNGGEVKVTRASRDGGVDAVAFDSDPIRGGKIVIQAKRYTNPVGVSAVRDLYGTVMNEGANKGILVTTSDYGPDAYAFAKDKPLTLLNGGNLLHLLEKHGHKAKIDLKEAKALLIENERNKT